jgi:5-methylthioadenosine/S-adenosylhomocysteine deaminase
VLTFDEQWKEFKNGYVFIEDDVIGDVGDDPEMRKKYAVMADEVHDAKGRWVMPGLVNAHTHMFQTFLRGLADDKPLLRWLKEEIYPFSGIMEEEDFYLSGLVGCLENLKNGATSVIDQHYVHMSPFNSDKVFEAMEKTGIRGYNCRTFGNRLPHKPLEEKKEHILSELERLKETWHGKDNGRLNLMMGPLNPWGSTTDMFEESFAFAEKHDLLYQLHTAETQGVVQATVDEYGLRNVEFFDSMGIISERTQLAHAVWLSDKEKEIVRDKGAMVVHNPVANMYLASGVAPIMEYKKMGIPVALATDGPGSNNSQDMMEVLKTTACLQKVHSMDAMIIYPEDVLGMAVRDGAKALGRDDIGSLEKGKKADIIMVNWKKHHIAPVHKANSALVYNVNGNDVDSVWVDGKLVVKEKSAVGIDEEALLEACQERADYLYQKAKGVSISG